MKLSLCFIIAGVALALPMQAVVAQQESAQGTAATNPVVPDEASITIAREIIDLGMPPEKREAIFFATMEQMMAQMKEAQQQADPIDDPQVEAIIDRTLAEFKADAMVVLSVHLPDIMEGWALAYANIFSPEELSDIRDFVATPSGQRFFELSPAITAEPNFAAANQRYMNDVMGLLPSLQEKLKADIFDYFSSLEAQESSS